jgi:hypothetical protein
MPWGMTGILRHNYLGNILTSFFGFALGFASLSPSSAVHQPFTDPAAILIALVPVMTPQIPAPQLFIKLFQPESISNWYYSLFHEHAILMMAGIAFFSGRLVLV